MSARTTRTRLLAAAALSVATLSLTACSSAEGVRDEGASAGSSSVTSSSKARADTAASQNGSTGTSGTKESSASGGSSGAKDTTAVSRPPRKKPSATRTTPCRTVRTTATVVSRPLNHILLTVTNTGSGNCDLTRYPAVRFGEAQSVPPAFEDSKPQAVVTLAPGESGYAGVLLSAADGSGSNGYTATSLEVYLDTDSQKPVTPSLPKKGVYVDDSIQVTYWQSSMADALAW